MLWSHYSSHNLYFAPVVKQRNQESKWHAPIYHKSALRSVGQPFASSPMVQIWSPYLYRYHGQKWFENIPRFEIYTLPGNSFFFCTFFLSFFTPTQVSYAGVRSPLGNPSTEPSNDGTNKYIIWALERTDLYNILTTWKAHSELAIKKKVLFDRSN